MGVGGMRGEVRLEKQGEISRREERSWGVEGIRGEVS